MDITDKPYKLAIKNDFKKIQENRTMVLKNKKYIKNLPKIVKQQQKSMAKINSKLLSKRTEKMRTKTGRRTLQRTLKRRTMRP